MDILGLALQLVAAIISPIAKLAASGAVALVRKTSFRQDDDFLRQLAQDILADLDAQPPAE